MKTPFEDPRLSDYLFGELSPKERVKLEKELADNPELRSELEELRSLGVELKETFRQEEVVMALDELQRQKIRRGLEESIKKQEGSFAWLSRLTSLQQHQAFSFACSLLLVGVVFLLLKDAVIVSPEHKHQSINQPQPLSVATEMKDVALDEVIEENSDTVSLPLSEKLDVSGEMSPRDLDMKPAEVSAYDLAMTESVSSTIVATGEGASGSKRVYNVFGSTQNAAGYSRPTVVTSPANRSEAGEFRLNARKITTREGRTFDGFIEYGNSATGEAYSSPQDNPFKTVSDEPLSTFSIDVDTASYTNLRRMLNQGQLPPPEAVRIEEMLNYFTYDYPKPEGKDPFAVSMEIAECPWNPEHKLAHVGIQGREVRESQRPALNLVFLVDVSGSMSSENKLPLVKKSLELLVKNLKPEDRVALVTYAGNSRLVLPSTSAKQKEKILEALGNLESGGSTNGEGGIRQAYQVARQHYLNKGLNRVILATDGDFNVGISDREELIRLIQSEAKSGVFLNIFGFGMGNLKDATLEQLANKGNGIYGYIDGYQEARKMFVEQINSTLITIAKDVKIQIEFNPAKVAAYRLIGYENRMLNKEDFNDDRKDAGEVGAGHSVTALYELIPAGAAGTGSRVDPLKYQRQPVPPSSLSPAAQSRELMTLKLRYKEPAADTSKLMQVVAHDAEKGWKKMSDDFRFSAAVASFGMILRESPHRGNSSFGLIQSLAEESLGPDPEGYRREFLRLTRTAGELKDGRR